MFDLQPPCINNEEALVLQEGTGPLDLARAFYDPDRLEVVISLEAKDLPTIGRSLGPSDCFDAPIGGMADGRHQAGSCRIRRASERLNANFD